MFGMLDYRAHKLLWLLIWPFTTVQLVASYALLVAVAIYVRVEFVTYHPLLQIVGAWVAAQFAMSVLALLFFLVVSLVKKLFFWTIDVVPAHGEDADEARQVVLMGPIYALNKKLDWHIDTWTNKDSEALIACLNWRARWFFPVKQRAGRLIEELQKVRWDQGKQPGQVPPKTMDDLRNKIGKPSWFEIAMTNPYFFHGILGLAVIVVVILWNR
jgi:hypothetical protein